MAPAWGLVDQVILIRARVSTSRAAERGGADACSPLPPSRKTNPACHFHSAFIFRIKRIQKLLRWVPSQLTFRLSPSLLPSLFTLLSLSPQALGLAPQQWPL